MGAMTTEGISILVNESEGGCLDNRRYFILLKSRGGGEGKGGCFTTEGISILLKELGGGGRGRGGYCYNRNISIQLNKWGDF